MTTVQVPECCFARIIADIIQAGITKAQLARALNVPFTTLVGWANGASPSWHHGEAIRIVQKRLMESRIPVTQESRN